MLERSIFPLKELARADDLRSTRPQGASAACISMAVAFLIHYADINAAALEREYRLSFFIDELLLQRQSSPIIPIIQQRESSSEREEDDRFISTNINHICIMNDFNKREVHL